MLYKRSKKPGSPWWTRFTIKGREIRVTSGTASKTLAEEFERRLRDQLWREIELGEVQHSWEEARERWLKEKAHKRSLNRDKEAFAALETYLGGMATVDISDELLQVISGKLCEGRKPGTVNRIMAVPRAVLNRALKVWKWPGASPKIEQQHVDKADPRWLTQEQFETLWRELPPHARQIVRFAVAVGPRSGNIFNLRWRDVDFVAGVFRVGADEFKGKRSVGFPLPSEAVEVLRQQEGQHPEYVFTDQRGRAPIGSIKTCWHKATKRAGVPGLRVHDLRHTFAAWHKLAGTPDHALQQLGGWSDLRMVQKYGHINPQDYAHFSNNRRTRNGTDGNEK
jgi:integrase